MRAILALSSSSPYFRDLGSVYTVGAFGFPEMGRIQKGSMRTRIQDSMKHLKKRFRAALKDDELQEAFDDLWPAWSSEMAAMIYAEVLSAMDMLLLMSVVDNRREIIKLKASYIRERNKKGAC